MFLLSLRRSYARIYTIHARPAASISNIHSRSAGWEPWEDEVIKDYIATNGTKWTNLVQHCLPHKTANACQVRWNTILNPKLKRGPLSPMEGYLLRQGVAEFGVGKWSKIAEKYMPDRSPHQLSNAWTNALDPVLVKKKQWTQDEDDKLLEGIKQYGLGQWTKIKKNWLPHRPHQAIRNRYAYHLDPTLQQDKAWTTDEVDILLRRTVLFGTDDWVKVAEGLAGRSPPQCRRQYTRHIDPARTRRGLAWDTKDVKLFWELVRIHQGRWKNISKYMERTEEECLLQFRCTLQQELKVFYPADVLKQQQDESKPAWKKRIGEIMSNHLAQDQRARIGSNKSLILEPSTTAATTTATDVVADRQQPMTDVDDSGGLQQQQQQQQKTGRRPIRWTTEESKLLEQLVEKYGCNWDLVAQHHGAKTARQCANRYKNVIRYQHDTYIANQPLTQSEKDLIIQGVDMFGHDWVAITNTYLPRRKPYQCMRWYLANIGHDNKQVDDDEDTATPVTPPTAMALLARSASAGLGTGRGRWTTEEDERLRFAINEYSNNNNDKYDTIDWTKVALLVNTGRTPLQCRHHWKNTLNPSISKKGPWGWNEKLQLVELVQKSEMAANTTIINSGIAASEPGNDHATKERFWEEVAKALKTGRSPWSCRLKYAYMVRTGTLFKS